MNSGDNEYLWHKNYRLEVAILYTIAALGVTLNVALTISILMAKQFRNLLSAFIIHGALINAILASYCVVFALSLHDSSFQNLCKYLGSSFVVIMTANIVNLIAIIASEVYKLNFTIANSNSDNNNGSVYKHSNVCCVIFGLSIVYVASLILHLGPTLIGGNFESDSRTGFCLFIFGQKKNYVVFVVWVVIVTLVLVACTYYLVHLHGNLNQIIKQNLASFTVFRCSVGSVPTEEPANLDLILTKSRAWTLSCITGLHILCWYPLFGLLISDREFLVPIGLYRALTCLAWSNSFLEPLIYLLIDRKSIYCCHKVRLSKPKTIKNSSTRLERIGDRLKSAVRDGEYDEEEDGKEEEEELDREMAHMSRQDWIRRTTRLDTADICNSKSTCVFVC